MSTLPHLDPDLSPEERADGLLARLTLDEKAGELTHYFSMKMGELPDDFDIESLPEEQRASHVDESLTAEVRRVLEVVER